MCSTKRLKRGSQRPSKRFVFDEIGVCAFEQGQFLVTFGLTEQKKKHSFEWRQGTKLYSDHLSVHYASCNLLH